MLKARTINILFLTLLMIMILFDMRGSVSMWLYVLVGVTYFALMAYGSAVLSAEFFHPVKWKGPDESNAIALTFDDGPIAGKTDRILNILQAYNAPAAFFCIGKNVDQNVNLTRSIHHGGHLVCNHSYWHKSTFDLQSASRISKELQATDNLIEKTIGHRPAFFRPPFGVINPMVASAIRAGKYTTIGWSIRSLDTVITDKNKLVKRITRSLKSGDIILLHDQGHTTVEILPTLLEHIRSVGLKIVRLDKLLNEEAYV